MKKTTTMYASRFKTYFVKTNTIHFRGLFNSNEAKVSCSPSISLRCGSYRKVLSQTCLPANLWYENGDGQAPVPIKHVRIKCHSYWDHCALGMEAYNTA